MGGARRAVGSVQESGGHRRSRARREAVTYRRPARNAAPMRVGRPRWAE